jgi:hypothetical protein
MNLPGAALVWEIITACTFHTRVTDSNDNTAYFIKKEIFPLNLKACKNEDIYDYEWSSNWWLRMQLQVPLRCFYMCLTWREGIHWADKNHVPGDSVTQSLLETHVRWINQSNDGCRRILWNTGTHLLACQKTEMCSVTASDNSDHHQQNVSLPYMESVMTQISLPFIVTRRSRSLRLAL